MSEAWARSQQGVLRAVACVAVQAQAIPTERRNIPWVTAALGRVKGQAVHGELAMS